MYLLFHLCTKPFISSVRSALNFILQINEATCGTFVKQIFFTFSTSSKYVQAVGLTYLVPGSYQLIQTGYLAAPPCPRGDGESLKDSIVGVTDSYIEPQQFAGMSGDGVYVTTGVGSKLDKYYDVKGHHDWDYMR